MAPLVGADLTLSTGAPRAERLGVGRLGAFATAAVAPHPASAAAAMAKAAAENHEARATRMTSFCPSGRVTYTRPHWFIP
jgi:hypothetical protein